MKGVWKWGSKESPSCKLESYPSFQEVKRGKFYHLDLEMTDEAREQESTLGTRERSMRPCQTLKLRSGSIP